MVTQPVVRFVVMPPVLSILNRVVVADAVDEPMAKRVSLVSPLLAWIERSAKGVEVPRPVRPPESMLSKLLPSTFSAASDAAPSPEPLAYRRVPPVVKAVYLER